MLIIEASMIHTILLLESISTPHLQMLEVHLEGMLPVGSTTDQMQFFSTVGVKARLTTYHTLFVSLEEKFANVVGFLGMIAHDSAPLHSNTFHLSLKWDNPVYSTQSHAAHHSALLPHLHSISLMLDHESQTILNEYLAQLSASYPMVAVEVVTT